MARINRGNAYFQRGQRGSRHFRGTRGRPFFNRNTRPQRSDNANTSCTVYQKLSGKLTEKDVGITEYLGKHEGFSGVIKQRYSDFLVNEIDCDGNIVTLTTTKPPLPPSPAEVSTDQKKEAEEYLKSGIPPDTLNKLKQLIESEGDDVLVEVTDLTKGERKKMHLAIHTLSSKKLMTNTTEKDGKKYVIVSQNNSGKNENDGCNYVHFVTYKENMDTLESVNLISSSLRINPYKIHYAGTKDSCAKTSQQMSVRMDHSKLMNAAIGIPGVALGNYSLKRKGLKLGELLGNHFRIVLRNVTTTDEQIEEAMTSLKDEGFLNYYCLQRFETSSISSEIGKALLQGNWKLAIDLILQPCADEENSTLREALRIWWETNDAFKASRTLIDRERSKTLAEGPKLPGRSIEGRLLEGLSRHGTNDYVNALESIPRNTRLLYLHSYQSLIWNRVLTRRIQQFGLQPLVGDLVAEDCTGLEETEEENPEFVEEVAVVEKNLSKNLRVKVLVTEDLSSVSIEDILLPLPGHDVEYPENIMKEWFEDLMEVDGLSPTDLKQKGRKYTLTGAYRKIVQRPKSMSWKTWHYSDPEKTLVLSDLERMEGVQEPEDEPDAAYKALIVDFQLPASAYVTMALRELLRSDTSSYNQAALSNEIDTPQKTKVCSPDEKQEKSDDIPSGGENTEPSTSKINKSDVPADGSELEAGAGSNIELHKAVDGKEKKESDHGIKNGVALNVSSNKNDFEEETSDTKPVLSDEDASCVDSIGKEGKVVREGEGQLRKEQKRKTEDEIVGIIEKQPKLEDE